jgi:hypothetical protein
MENRQPTAIRGAIPRVVGCFGVQTVKMPAGGTEMEMPYR